MGHKSVLWGAVLFVSVVASPHVPDTGAFARSAVETVPHHEPLGPPIRSSVESIPLRNLREETEGRLPLRDAVEQRPIPVLDRESLYKYIQDPDYIENIEDLKHYYGAATYLNKNNGSRTDERLQLGNANLQEMQQTAGGPAAKRIVVCYLESWAAYRAPPLAFTAGLVPRSCTHLHYAYAAIHPHTYAVMPANEDYDIIKGGYRIATGLKRRMNGLRVIISVGGDGTDRLFSEMVQDPYRRNSFIESAISFLREHDFDGLDLHWVYAGDKDEKEKELLTRLLYELREKFASYGLLLSTVLPPFRYQIEDGYDLSAVSGATDYVILQAWDMTHSKRDDPPSRAVQHSALHRDPGAASRDQRYDNIEFMVKYIIKHGMAADKLVLGIPLFGRSYTLAASTLPSPGAAITGWGDEGVYTQTKGLLAYFEICMAEREGKGVSGVDEAGNSFAVFENQWITYDTPDTVVEKMKFVISNGLAGAAAWAIDMDDFRGLCGRPFPILSAISTSLNGENTITDQSSLKIGSCEGNTPYLASDEESCAHFHFCTGGISYRMICEDERLYDPSTGFCGHQDVEKCIPGQSLRISVEDATRFLSQAYEIDYEWSYSSTKDSTVNRDPERLVVSDKADVKRGKENDKRMVCYMTSWAFYRRGEGKFVPEQIDTRLCTHVVYAYASLSPDELVAKEFDPWTDITNNLYERVTSLKDVKVLLGLGGWTDSAGDKYSRLVSSGAARTKFAERLVAFLRLHNFKGLHLDWNYPVCWQSNCKKGAKSDKANFAKLVQELSKILHSNGMELGVALSGYKEVIDSAYDLPAISAAADFMSSMTYDYHGGWERTTAHHTPLIPPQKDALSYYSIEYAIKSMINGGVDPKKLLLGLAFYGQSYRLADVERSAGPGAPAAGPGESGEFTKQPGMLSYYEICYRIKNLRWKTGRQNNAGPYAYSDYQWVGYDDPKSITEKVDWAVRQGLGGVTAWAIDLDDFNNMCCAEPMPLLRAAGRALGRSVPAPPTSRCERPPEPVTPSPPTTTPAESDGSIGGGDHGSHNHHTSTWPSWSPSTTSTTAQTWWSPTTTPSTTTAQSWWSPSTTTTSTTSAQTWWPPATTTSSTTTTRRTTTTTTRRPTDTGVEGASCVAGEYRSAPGDCEAYLQCEGGQWRKHRCAPGLHWSARSQRCDWPLSAKCSETSNDHAVSTTTTLAPINARPPTTTTRRTITTTRTTPRPITRPTARPTISAVTSDGAAEGGSCNGQQYHEVLGDCNSYLHCDGTSWRLQHCAPGLHWSAKEKHCDWPKYAKCEGSTPKTTTVSPMPTRPPRPTRPDASSPSHSGPVEETTCGGNDMHAPGPTCDSYLLCVNGRWKKEICRSGLHWDKRTNRCDWIEFAMCEATKPQITKVPALAATTTTTTTTTTRKPPTSSTTKKPNNVYEKPSRCVTGTYHSHPHCSKFYVCVNNVLVTQSCAPGLVWRHDRSQCDFPSASSCTDRRQVTSAAITDASKPDLMQIQEVSTFCENGQYAMDPTDCTRYRHCLFGKFEEFSCAVGLHWNQDKQICDWPNSAKCKIIKVTTTTTTTTSAPSFLDPLPAENPPLDPDTEDLEIQRPQKPIATSPIAVGPESRPALLNTRYKLVCYFSNWAWYRPGLGKYSPEDIDPSLCTHIVYGFAVLKDGVITAHDPWADYDNRFYERVVEYKKYGAKVSIAIGGWKDSVGDKYSRLVNSPETRANFVRHAVQFIEKYGFDGLDLDWEYPKCWQVDCSKGPDSDKEGFANLVRELSAVFKPKGLLLSSAVSPSKMVIDAGYDVPILARHLDWIAVMTYDYHGQWDKKTGHVAPLYYHPEDDYTYFNANYTMHYWMEKGAPASKLVMGMPLYGQTFTLGSRWGSPSYSARNKVGLNIPAIAGGDAGEYTRANGFLAYYEICERIRERNWIVVKDPLQRMGPFAFKGNQWVSFDDTEIIKKKVNFIKSLNLAGGMVWALDLDDFQNRCNQGKYPLMNAIKNSFLDSSMDEQLIETKPIEQHPIDIDNDLEDIEVRPGYTKPSTKPTQRPTYRPTARPTTAQQTTTTESPVLADPIEEERYKVVCYYTNWAWYRSESGKYTPEDIDPSLCTHIVYAFAVLDGNKLVIKPHDTFLDIENKFYEKVVALKSRGVKVVLGLGGWNDSAGDKYSRLVNNPSARRKFIVHAIDFLEQYEFDGLDLDWEYPRCWQVECEKGPTSDKQGFADLVKELHAAFAPKGLLLSAAVSASKRIIDLAYDVPALSRNLDWIALMTYDYHGQWDHKTGHVAPMYEHEMDDDSTFNVNFTVNYWVTMGAARQKLIMGVPFYGQSFSLMENAGNGLGAPTYAGGEAGDETRARGFLAFYEICDRIRSQGWKVSRDPGGRIGPYATLNDQWVSFDDDFMVRHKAEYIRANDLGGSMVWSLDLDDFTGEHCGCGKSPLLSNINHVLREREAPPTCSLEEIESPAPNPEVEETNSPPKQEPEEKPSNVLSDSEVESDGSSLEGKSCSGTVFREDDTDCRKYYLCINEEYIQLSCPSSLYWNKNHCDLPEKSRCRGKANLRITGTDVGEVVKEKPIVACYFTNWAYYRPSNGSFGPEQIDPTLCTHIIYAWARLDNKTYKVIPGIPELDIANDFYGKITEYKVKGIKVILGVGGVEDSEGKKWGEMTSSIDSRNTFVQSVLKFIRRWKFDGVQIAWQYPVCKQAPCTGNLDMSERNNFSALLAELAKSLRYHNLELSAMVSPNPEVASVAYDSEVLVATLDWMSIAANDYYGLPSKRTSYILPLESDDMLENNLIKLVAYWSRTAPARQLVLSVPAYGRAHTLRSAIGDSLHAPVTAPAPPGPYTAVPGFLAYYEICNNVKSNNWKETSNAVGTYAVYGSQWTSYLRPSEVFRMVASASRAGFRGAGLWALDLDDWRGICSCQPWPLLTALRQGLFDPSIPPSLCS